MDSKELFNFCRGLGCCNACCLRYIGVKNYNNYKNLREFIKQFQEDQKSGDVSDFSQNDLQISMEKTEENKNNSKNNLEEKHTVQDSGGNTELQNTANSEGKAKDFSNSKLENRYQTTTSQSQCTKASEKFVSDNDGNTELQNPPISEDKAKDFSNTKLENRDQTTISQSQCTKASEKLVCDNDGSPPKKKCKIEICVSCLGVLQEDTWPKGIEAVKEVLDKKKYECLTFACALSAPLTTLLREKAVCTALCDKFPDYNATNVTPLKEAWKSTFGEELEKHLNMALDSGAIAPLLITVNIDYPNEMQELDLLKNLSPRTFSERGKQKRRFVTEFTKVSVEAALADIRVKIPISPVVGRAECVSVVCAHAPVYLGGRYIKLCRSLPQTPWLVAGKRMMESSVQEIIFEPLAKLYGLSPEESESQMKFISAGREDVDVRCLGDGRPFAVEVSDPRRSPTEEELRGACAAISAGKRVHVARLVPVISSQWLIKGCSCNLWRRHRNANLYLTVYKLRVVMSIKEALSELKKGEETKCKNYQALCIKLEVAETDQGTTTRPAEVTSEDIERIRAFSNTETNRNGSINSVETEKDKTIERKSNTLKIDSNNSLEDKNMPSEGQPRIRLLQRTPLRVLHRRPLLTRQREIYEIDAEKVAGAPELFVLHIQTSAGTYVKEFVCGELGRSTPALGEAINARADILALDVTDVRLAWP